MNGQIRSCCFDLECTSLNADYGILLCGVIKPAQGPYKVFRGDAFNPRWAYKRSDDSALVKAVVQELLQYDIWIGFNAQYFDVPFLRSRLAYWGLPGLPARKLVDPLLIARNKLRLSSNSLESLGEFMSLGHKRKLSQKIWLQAALDGCVPSLAKIVHHCKRDVRILHNLVGRLREYSTSFNTYGSAL